MKAPYSWLSLTLSLHLLVRRDCPHLALQLCSLPLAWVVPISARGYPGTQIRVSDLRDGGVSVWDQTNPW